MNTGNETYPINICFVANFYKTFLFHELSIKLIKNQIGVYWIVTKLDQYKFLKAHYTEDRILYLNRSYIHRTENAIGDFKINELVYGDRVLKHEMKNGLNFLSNIQLPIYNFLLRNKIRFIFGEITWAHELLLHRIAKTLSELNCQYLECSVVRIPNNRFAFFTDETQYDMLEFNNFANKKEIIKLEKPAYLKINDEIVYKNKSATGRLNRLKRFLTGENIETNDPNVITNLYTRVKIATKEELNKNSYNWIHKATYNDIKDETYIFVGFHKQPESSIDVSGRYYEDQSLNIINLWRLLPLGWKLVIKEHTNAIGDRSYNFYKRLLSYPGIMLIDEKVDSKLLIENSRLVASVTGTICYEAALLKKASITFSKVFFNRINYCKFAALDTLLTYENLSILATDLNSQADNRLEFSEYLLKNTFEGYITDPMTDPAVLADENIEKIYSAFIQLIQHHG